MTQQTQTGTQTNSTDTTTNTNGNSIVSPQYAQGETTVEKNVLEMVGIEIQKQLNRFLIYIITTLLVAGVVAFWTMNTRVSGLEGKYSAPDKTIETISTRLETLEKTNKELVDKNHQLEIEKLRLELTPKVQTTKNPGQ